MRALALLAGTAIVAAWAFVVLLDSSKRVPAVAAPPSLTLSPEAIQLRIDARTLPETEFDSAI
jgi:hypothetical protein